MSDRPDGLSFRQIYEYAMEQWSQDDFDPLPVPRAVMFDRKVPCYGHPYETGWRSWFAYRWPRFRWFCDEDNHRHVKYADGSEMMWQVLFEIKAREATDE